jgi:hypothetical protein
MFYFTILKFGFKNSRKVKSLRTVRPRERFKLNTSYKQQSSNTAAEKTYPFDDIKLEKGNVRK